VRDTLHCCFPFVLLRLTANRFDGDTLGKARTHNAPKLSVFWVR
jgi:hypothetical protein